MIVIPAIDIKDGRCVRLKQGRMDDATVFSDQPDEMARRWYQEAAQRLHIVDLDGAVRGRPVNRETIHRIVRAVPIPVQLGGGIRDMETLHAYFELGLSYLILGTVAHKNPEFVLQACNAFPGQVIVGIDARDGKVAVEGWTEETSQGPRHLAARFDSAGPAAVVYTDIHRDGMQTGPNVTATQELARGLSTAVIASGGISGLEDVRSLLPLAADGVMGMITGRAIYEGTLDLGEAIRIAADEEH